MRNFLFRLGSIAEDIAFILSPEYKLPKRGKLLRSYLRLRTKVFLNRWMYFKEESLLGYTIRFANYSLFFETFRQIFVRQSYYFESENDAPTIIDCGGNAGMSVLYFKYLYPESTVTVFEPSDDVRPILAENIKRNKLKNVTLEPFAVSDQDGEASFFERGTGSCGNTLVESVFESADLKGAKKEDKIATVKTRRLSSYVKAPIDLLKLDIEGAEGAVIEELQAAGVLEKMRTIAMEYHYYPANEGNKLGNMLSTFERADREYQIYMDELTPGSSMLLSHGSGYYCLIRSAAKKRR